jgi:hypothetical protein
MQKRIILALGISSIVGLVAAQEAPAEVASVVAEQNLTPEPVKESVSTESVPSSTGESQIVESTSDSVAPAQAEQTAAQLAPVEAPAPAPQPAVTTSEPSPAPVIQDSSATEPKKEFPAPVAIPLPVEESTSSDDSDEDLEIKGIDTVDVAEPKGNWLYKRIWWEKAERTYEKIKQLAEKIQEARILYFARRTDLDRNIMDPFYLGQGFSQGELTEIISYLTNQLEQERKDGTLDDKEQVLLNALTEEKKSLENLQKGVKAVANIDRALDDALLKLSEQLNQAHMYEQQAWENFKSINRELSDKRARELYYGMDTYWRNLNNINTYISDSFSQYFDQLTDKVKQEIERIKSTMDALKEKGIDIQLQAQKLKAGKPAEPEEEIAPQTSEPQGILGTVWHWVKAPFAAVADMFGGLLGLITGSGSGPEELALARPERSKE